MGFLSCVIKFQVDQIALCSPEHDLCWETFQALSSGSKHISTDGEETRHQAGPPSKAEEMTAKKCDTTWAQPLVESKQPDYSPVCTPVTGPCFHCLSIWPGRRLYPNIVPNRQPVFISRRGCSDGICVMGVCPADGCRRQGRWHHGVLAATTMGSGSKSPGKLSPLVLRMSRG